MAKLTLPAQELMYSGHSACPGCGPALAMRLLLKGTGPKTILSIPACCWTVIATPFPTTALGVAAMDNAIEATGAAITGVRAACDALGMDDATVVGFAGDGGTTDIGIQALSGMLERETDAIFVMYDNEAYMNTGVQRSGATPAGASTTTTPVLGSSHGKIERKKDIMAIVLAHRPVYAATLNPSYPEDFVKKVEKAKAMKGGARFLHVLTPCPPGWKFSSEETIELGRLATDTGLFPLYEVENGKLRITRRLSVLKPIEEYLKRQGRFRHLTKADRLRIQEEVRAEWARIVGAEKATAAPAPAAPLGAPSPPEAAAAAVAGEG
ncbi:MAG TPA: thiamine pyrophosphate-dependent enzyme [Thermoplasmata archaeon]|nr:thiamine pyrophosphate-dependent enzyme [Thermoplasmata archaeon]